MQTSQKSLFKENSLPALFVDAAKNKGLIWKPSVVGWAVTWGVNRGGNKNMLGWIKRIEK